jgi:uncharacterized protein YcgI (DUF1989 family)
MATTHVAEAANSGTSRSYFASEKSAGVGSHDIIVSACSVRFAHLAIWAQGSAGMDVRMKLVKIGILEHRRS